jgi:hypothetical protein
VFSRAEGSGKWVGVGSERRLTGNSEVVGAGHRRPGDVLVWVGVVISRVVDETLSRGILGILGLHPIIHVCHRLGRIRGLDGDLLDLMLLRGQKRLSEGVGQVDGVKFIANARKFSRRLRAPPHLHIAVRRGRVGMRASHNGR